MALRRRAGPPSGGWSAIQETGISGHPLWFGTSARHGDPAPEFLFIGWHLHIDTISALGFFIWIGTTSFREPRRPLLVFNGIGASIELTEPFTEAMQRRASEGVVAKRR